MKGASSSFQVETRKRRHVTVPPRTAAPYPAHRWAHGQPITTVGEAATIVPPKAPPLEAAFPEGKEPASAVAPPKEGETKAERFYRLVPARMKKALWAIDQVTYCADPERYEFTEEDARILEAALRQRMNVLRTSFKLPVVNPSEGPDLAQLQVRANAVLEATLADVTRELDAVRDATLESLRAEAAVAKAAAEKLEASLGSAEEQARKRRAELLDDIRVKVTQAIAEGNVVPIRVRSPLEELFGVPAV